MKAIENLNNLVDILNEEDNDWQKKIYNEIGVLVLINQHGGVLLSNCGYIDLVIDAEYVYLSGNDKTEYTSIKSIQELIDYILNMESYHRFLVDMSLGQFTKSELFWSVQNQIVLAEENQHREDGSAYQDWGLYRISTETRPISPYNENNEEVIVLDMALVDYDTTEILIPRREDFGLSDALKKVTTEMNTITEDINDIPQYSVYCDKQVIVPNSFDDIERLIQPNGLFSWLR